MITAAGAVLTGFVVTSASAASAAGSALPPHSLLIYPRDTPRDAEQTRSLVSTVERVVGDVTVLNSYQAVGADAPRSQLIARSHRRGSAAGVAVVDEGLLSQLIGSHHTEALQTFRNGGVVTTERALVRDSTAPLLLDGARGRGDDQRWELPATAVTPPRKISGEFMRAWISEQTAANLGLRTRPYVSIALTSRPVTNEDLTRLAVYGIDARSEDPPTRTGAQSASARSPQPGYSPPSLSAWPSRCPRRRDDPTWRPWQPSAPAHGADVASGPCTGCSWAWSAAPSASRSASPQVLPSPKSTDSQAPPCRGSASQPPLSPYPSLEP